MKHHRLPPLYLPTHITVDQCFLKHGLQASGISTIRELVRRANYWAPDLQNQKFRGWGPASCALVSVPSDSDEASSLRSDALGLCMFLSRKSLWLCTRLQFLTNSRTWLHHMSPPPHPSFTSFHWIIPISIQTCVVSLLSSCQLPPISLFAANPQRGSCYSLALFSPSISLTHSSQASILFIPVKLLLSGSRRASHC